MESPALPGSMYTQLLQVVWEEAQSDGAAEELLKAAVTRRRALDVAESAHGQAVEKALAANLAYDVALLRLCAAHGVDVDPLRFSRPLVERRLLETELTRRGVELDRRSENVADG